MPYIVLPDQLLKNPRRRNEALLHRKLLHLRHPILVQIHEALIGDLVPGDVEDPEVFPEICLEEILEFRGVLNYALSDDQAAKILQVLTHGHRHAATSPEIVGADVEREHVFDLWRVEERFHDLHIFTRLPESIVPDVHPQSLWFLILVVNEILQIFWGVDVQVQDLSVINRRLFLRSILLGLLVRAVITTCTIRTIIVIVIYIPVLVSTKALFNWVNVWDTVIVVLLSVC